MLFEDCWWQNASVCRTISVHKPPAWSFICLLQETDVVLCPLGSLSAAGWWGWAHSLSSQDRGVERGSPYTPVQPFWLCQGSACWGDVPSVCRHSADPQTEVREPGRALEPDPSPAGTGTAFNSTKQWNCFDLQGQHVTCNAVKTSRYSPSAKNWPFSLLSH